jgi:hypothetical protein
VRHFAIDPRIFPPADRTGIATPPALSYCRSHQKGH